MFYVYLKKDEILVMISQEKKPCLRNFERSIIKSFKKVFMYKLAEIILLSCKNFLGMFFYGFTQLIILTSILGPKSKNELLYVS